jgi:hypothetical protein
MNANIGSEAPFKPFTRVITTPPSWPWDQMRAARLEATHTSPVAVEDVSIIVKRLEGWSFNEAGRFVAIYLRGSEARAGVSFKLDIQGKTINIDMPSKVQQATDAKAKAQILAMSLIITLGFGAMTAMSLKRREAMETRLGALEVRLEQQLRQARTLSRAKADAQSLEAQKLEANTYAKAIRVLDRVTNERDTQVRLDAFYWNRGYWGVESQGQGRPVKTLSLDLKRLVRPVRSGVYLWVASANGDDQ